MLRKLLWVDCTAGLLAGTAMLSLAGWLSRWYALPQALLLGMGVANLAYGTYSFSLARRARRPMPLLVLLVTANAAWAALCWILAALYADTASWLGMAHLIGEGLLVGGLAMLEWRQRERLLVAT